MAQAIIIVSLLFLAVSVAVPDGVVNIHVDSSEALFETPNPYTGQKVLLTPEAIAVYDTIKGAEMMGRYETMEKGIAWFQANYPKEYFVLLD